MKFILLITFLILSPLSKAHASGGVIVGNGAGFAEGLFQQSYQGLPLLVENILAFPDIIDNEYEKQLLRKIHNIAFDNSNKKNRLIFVSEKDHPDFFTTGENEHHRIAKTFSTPDSPIFVNTDWLNSDIGKKQLNYSAITALLIHEIGHQTGELDHAALDILGAKVKGFSDAMSNQYNFLIESSDLPAKSTISFVISNYSLPKKNSVLRFKNAKNSWANISSALVHALDCKEGLELEGFELSNAHYAFNQNQQLEFKSWVEQTCINKLSHEKTIKRRTLQISLGSSFDIVGLKLN